MNGPDVEGVLAGLVDTALRVESQHDPGCPGDERYCVLHCPVPVQVEVPLAHVAAAVLAEVRAWLESEGAVEVAARASYEHPGPEGQSRWSWDDKRVWDETRECWRSDTRAALAALAEQVAPSRVPGEET